MSAPSEPLSSAPLASGEPFAARHDPTADLDDRIRAAEAAVVARDVRMRLHVQALGDGLRSRTNLGVIGGAVLAVSGFLIARVLPFGPFSPARRRRRRARQHLRHPVSSFQREARQRERFREVRSLPWGRLVMLAWPLVPIAMRARVSPGIAGLATTLGLPLLKRLLTRRRG